MGQENHNARPLADKVLNRHLDFSEPRNSQYSSQVQPTVVTSMEYVQIKDPSGLGNWLLILGCPVEASHQLHDETHRLSGPTFAACAECVHQAGARFEHRDPDLDWSLGAFPEQLRCGYCESADEGEAPADEPAIQSSWKVG